MKKILLINPPFYRLMGSHYNGISLGLGYIAAVLKANGFEVKIYNADYEDRADYLNQKEIFDNYYHYKSVLNNPRHPIWQEIERMIRSFAPDVVGISMFTATYKSAQIVADIVKKIDAGIQVIVGGTHPSLDPHGTIQNDSFDLIIRNEGEFPFLSLMQGKKLDAIPGLVYKNNGQIIFTEEPESIKDIDALPFPERKAYLNPIANMDIGSVITGRGCPYDCAYCCSPALWRRKVSLRSVGNVVAELEMLASEYKSKLIHFQDDTFTLDIDRTKRICQEIIDKGLNISWICDTRVDRLNHELLEMMKAAGCVRVKIAVESGSDDILKRMKKRIDKQKIMGAVNLLKDVGIPFTVYLMVGFPQETNEQVRQTIDFGKSLEADYYSLSILAPYFGTEVYQAMGENGNGLDKEHWEYFFHQSRDMIVNKEIDPKLVEEFFALNDYGKGVRV